MPLNLQKPIVYVITSGATSPTSTPSSKDFQAVLSLLQSAISADVELFQLREKQLSDRVLFALTVEARRLTKDTGTQLLVNDRADIAIAAGADGVHLTTRSLSPSIVRMTFGSDLIIGVSTHSVAEVEIAEEGGADFVVFGPVFETHSKQQYGPPIGLESLRSASTRQLPVVALGGVNATNAEKCYQVGASGVAGIGMFEKIEELQQTVARLRASYQSSVPR